MDRIGWDDEKKLFFFTIYQKYHVYDNNLRKKVINPKITNENCLYILDVKNNKKDGIDYFSKKVIHFIDMADLFSRRSDIIITCVPSSEKDGIHEGMRNVIKNVCRVYPQLENGTGILRRTCDTKKKALGGSRDISVHYNSLEIEDISKYKSKVAILLDDVSVTGNSMTACIELLKSSGMDSVVPIVFGNVP